MDAISIILIAIGLSMDSFAVGISFAILNLSIVTPVLIIGLITFGFSLAGLQLGKYFGKQLRISVEVFGGIVLIGSQIS